MSKKKLKINYLNLRPMDLVFTSSCDPIAMVIRGVSAGWRNIFNRDIANHCGIVIELHGQLMIAEMLCRKGLDLESLNKYSTRMNRIVSVRRHYAYNSSLVRDAAQRRIALDLRYTLDYDRKGIMSFVVGRIEDDPKKYYCSEYVYMQTAADGITYPDSFATRVTPYDLQQINNGYTEVSFKL